MSRQTILAFILIGLIIIFYNDFITWLYPPPPPSPSDTTEEVRREPAIERTSQPVIAENRSIHDDFPTFPDQSADSSLVDTVYPKRTVTVETERFKAIL
ncbi:MAG: hypothetical protein P9M15_03125, partial [Candidatus Electryoneaceae bacterium]|nr:hypothetical protein [Candidatus Electryoneaceae bacterium]